MTTFSFVLPRRSRPIRQVIFLVLMGILPLFDQQAWAQDAETAPATTTTTDRSGKPESTESSATHSDIKHGDHPQPAADQGAEHPTLGKDLGLWTMLPFAVTLICIALLPLFAGHWW